MRQARQNIMSRKGGHASIFARPPKSLRHTRGQLLYEHQPHHLLVQLVLKSLKLAIQDFGLIFFLDRQLAVLAFCLPIEKNSLKNHQAHSLLLLDLHHRSMDANLYFPQKGSSAILPCLPSQNGPAPSPSKFQDCANATGSYLSLIAQLVEVSTRHGVI